MCQPVFPKSGLIIELDPQKFPWVAAGLFLKDAHDEGLGAAANNLVWPIPGPFPVSSPQAPAQEPFIYIGPNVPNPPNQNAERSALPPIFQAK